MYDIAICGGGTAGCALAARLTEDPKRRVILLEAGPAYWSEAELPRDVKYADRVVRDHNWRFMSEPVASSGDRTIPLPRGKLLGGCSATQLGIALRPSRCDMGKWTQAVRSSEWGFDRVLPYLERLEADTTVDSPPSRSGFVPIHRHSPETWLPVQRAFFEASRTLGYSESADLNAAEGPAVGACPLSTFKNGERWNAARSYLWAVRDRPNLTVLSDVVVDRIIVDDGRATGVAIIRNGCPETIRAASGIVLTAGAFGTPSILLRSGIGPPTLLRRLNIPLVAGTPGVGENLQDHPVISMAFLLKEGFGDARDPFFQVMLRGSSGLDADVDLHLLPRSSSRAYRHAPRGRFSHLIFVGLVRIASTGTLTLASSDPTRHPLINPGYLAVEEDRERLALGVIQARELAATDCLAALIDRELFPAHRAGATLRDLKEALPRLIYSYHHAVGACKMSSDDDAMGVVNVRLDVRGVVGLKVADASVAPVIPSVNTSLTVLMIAERCADFIAREW